MGVRFAGCLIAVCAAIAVGCGGTQKAADLFLVKRSGSIPGANLTLLVSDNSTVSCNGGVPRQLPGDLLVEARGLTEDLAADITKPVAEVPQVKPIYSFTVKLGAGTASWQDGSTGLPQSFLKLSQLTRQIAKGVCGLTR
jgi:hypothetical protein